jgi:hypothetical protein
MPLGASEDRRSIQLSYGRTSTYVNKLNLGVNKWQ